jgi:hypothetical protein
MSITKLDVAEREIIAAVQLLFSGGDPIPVSPHDLRIVAGIA